MPGPLEPDEARRRTTHRCQIQSQMMAALSLALLEAAVPRMISRSRTVEEDGRGQGGAVPEPGEPVRL